MKWTVHFTDLMCKQPTEEPVSISFTSIDIRAPFVMNEADKNDLDRALGFLARAYKRTSPRSTAKRDAINAAYSCVKAATKEGAELQSINEAIVAVRSALCLVTDEYAMNDLMVVTACVINVQSRHF